MTSNMDFTDKTQETLAAAIQLAKDYANAQGMSVVRRIVSMLMLFCSIPPTHCICAIERGNRCLWSKLGRRTLIRICRI